MIHSLVHTSAPKTLTGSSGFGVVAQTENFPLQIKRIISNNSGYQFSKKELRTTQDHSTVIFAHWSVPKGDGGQHVVTKISPCTPDQSGRPNRIAQHIVFEPEDMHGSGPATFAKQFCWMNDWRSEPRILEPINIPNDSLDCTNTPSQLSSEHAELAKLAALGRNSGIVLHLSKNTDPLVEISLIETITDPTTRWAMFWVINSQRTFMMPKHRLLVSVAENPVANEIDSLPIQHVSPNSITEFNDIPPPIKSISTIPPIRQDENRYIPPNSKEIVDLHEPISGSFSAKNTQQAEVSRKTESVSSQPSIGELNCKHEQPENLAPKIIAILITIIAIISLIFIVYQSSNLTDNYETNQPLQEDPAT